ncbi:DNA-binding transcriptional regulator [Lactobacillus helveticus]|uniref:sugar-binding transcriptional regulator n=1 Tax=Lactobacillus helveticus TaxID=1587 RepID=UPI0021822557|nr:sugar-binding domain-containing protein [Lactobacillus helveticus]MCT0165691.1 DNA-binding transcriptional regulator [Lactobacillus helveticus]MCT0192371.1 DNA-binding transcriptional regulator [Lactobacillus helveticus]
MAQLTDEQLASIAHDFYLSKLNIAEISQKYNLSRYLITKALDDAEMRGIVKIKITQGIKRNQVLERKFQKLFGLKEVFILKDSEHGSDDGETVVNFAAKQIQTYLQNTRIAGLTWGITVRSVINNFNEENFNKLYFVQLLGHAINSNRRKNLLMQEIAEKFHAKSLGLPTPLYILNPKIIPALKNEPYFKVIENCYHNLDLLFTGLGTIESFKTNPFLDKNYGPRLFQNIPEEQVAGFIMGRPYNIKGEFFSDFEKHICGISMNDITRTPIRFCIVRNRFKSKALLGALRSGIITHLVINDDLAQRVLREADQLLGG